MIRPWLIGAAKKGPTGSQEDRRSLCMVQDYGIIIPLNSPWNSRDREVRRNIHVAQNENLMLIGTIVLYDVPDIKAARRVVCLLALGGYVFTNNRSGPALTRALPCG